MSNVPPVPPELCGFEIKRQGGSTGPCVFTPHVGTPHSWAPDINRYLAARRPGETIRDVERRDLVQRHPKHGG